MWPIAMEGALKLKEISYIHAEAYAAGELKHGPLALIDEEMPVIVVAPNNDLLDKLKSNMQVVRARGGQLYVFAERETGLESEPGVKVIAMPHADRADRADRLHRAAAAARVSRGGAQGHGRRPAAQPREVRYRRIALGRRTGGVALGRPRLGRAFVRHNRRFHPER